MKHKHYYLLLLVVATLLVSCPVNHSSPTPPPSKPVAPQDPSAPTADVDGEVLEPEITAWKNGLSALLNDFSQDSISGRNDIYLEATVLTEVAADTNVAIVDTPNMNLTYYKGSYTSSKKNNKEINKQTGIMDVYGKYTDSGTSFKVYLNGVMGNGSEENEGGSAFFTGTATYTEGSTTYNLDANKAFSGDPIEDKTSPEYKANLILDNISFVENMYNLHESKTTFTNYEGLNGYTFNGKTVGVEKAKTKDNAFVSDQKYTDGTVSVTLQGDVKLIVRYDIKREGESKTITEGSYMHVKKVGEEKFKVFPTDQLTI